MKSNLDNDGLTSNPNRSAKDIIRGYEYQLWYSVRSWINLKAGEKLLLEGAEDIDKFSGSTVDTFQVKDTPSQNISLRSTGPTEAINNFWLHTQANSNFIITFHYITTSGTSKEDGSPFGERKGIELWNSVSGSDIPEIEDIINFILNDTDASGMNRFSAELRNFVRNGSHSEIYNKLISRLKWSLFQPDVDQVKSYVHNALIEHGYKYNVGPTDSCQVADVLFQKALTAARKKNIDPLTFADFLQIFEARTHTSVPKSFVTQQRSYSLEERMTLTIPFLEMQVPKIPFEVYYRKQLIDDLKLILDKQHVLVINGLSGSGKTTAAIQLASTFEEQWLTVSFRGVKDNKVILEGLSLLNLYMQKSRELKNVIIDDLITL